MLSKVKLLIVFFDLGIGGIQRKIVDIANYSSKEHNVHILLQKKTSFTLANKVNSNVTISYHNGLQKTFAFYITIAKHVFISQPDIVLTFYPSNLLVLYLINNLPFLKKRFKLVLSIDNPPASETNSLNDYFIIKKIYPKLSTILVQTKIIQKQLFEMNINKNNIKIIPNWSLDNSLLSQGNRPIDILYCGRFSKQKNLVRWVSIINIIHKKKPNIKTVLIGSGNDEAVIKNIIKNSNLTSNIKVVNSLSNLKPFYSKSKIFLLSSNFESQPIALIEAMIHGVIPVIPASFGTSVFHLNSTDFVFNSDEQASDIILKLLDDNKKRMNTSKKVHLSTIKSFGADNLKQYLKELLN